MFDAYNRHRTEFIKKPELLIRLEEFIHKEIRQLLKKNIPEIQCDYDEASFLFPFWQNYPPEERGRSPRGDQFPWIEVGEHSVGCKLARYLGSKFAVREIGLPAGTDQRFLLRSEKIKEILLFTDAAMLFVDIKSVGPRDDFDHTVLSPYQVSGDGLWKHPDKGVLNSVAVAKGGRASHPFHCALPPLYVLSDGCVAPTVSVFVKPVYEMLSERSVAAKRAKLFGKLESKKESGEVLTKTEKPLERITPEAEKLYAIGQPLLRITLITLPNGLLLTSNPNYSKKFPSLFYPGKDDKTKTEKKLRARISFPLLREIAEWRVEQISVSNHS